MTLQRQYFGTDGIRGKVGETPTTPELMMKLGWAVGKVLVGGEAKSRVLIGKDTRISGYMFESALEAGLSAAGVDIHLLGPMPTPAIAYLTRTFRADAGIVISASHNAYHDNGVKFFSTDGFKLADEIELRIEEYMQQPMVTVPSAKLGKASRINDAAGRYIEYCKSTFPSNSQLNELKIVVDCANGATYRIAPNVFHELGAHVITLANKPDGLNINAACGSTQPLTLQKTVIAEKADLGIGLDGDGDRLILIDKTGAILDGDEILYIIAAEGMRRGILKGGVIGTQMSNMGLEIAIQKLGLPFARSKVGDRYVIEELRQRQWKLGGEPSGHIICLGVTTTGDGIVAALQVLRAMLAQDKALHELKQGMHKLPQATINVPCLQTHRAQLVAHPTIQDLILSVSHSLNGNGRVLIRPSGTEALIRVMVEGESMPVIENHAQKIAAMLRELAS